MMRSRLRVALLAPLLIGGCARDPEPVMPSVPVRTPLAKHSPQGDREGAGAATPEARAVTGNTAGNTAPAASVAPRPAATRSTPAAAGTPGNSATPRPAASTPDNRATPRSAAAGDTEELAVRAAVEAWRRAWQAKDIERYLGCYAESFSGEGKNLAQWAAHKRGVFSRVAEIQVAIDALEIELSGERASAVFRQTYSAGGRPDTGTKTLGLARIGGEWRIVTESFRKGR